MQSIELNGMVFLCEDGNLFAQGSGNDPYPINIEGETCGCPSFKYSKELPQTCKHIKAAVAGKNVLIPWRDKSAPAFLED